MDTFRCAECGAQVTAAVRKMPLPEDAPAPYQMEDGRDCPPRVPPGNYAVDPEPSGAPWVPSPDGAGYGVPGGPRNAIVLAPADVRGLRRVADRGRLNGCCGLDGLDGPNLACAGCGSELATESSDCWTRQQVALVPHAVTRHRGGTADQSDHAGRSGGRQDD